MPTTFGRYELLKRIASGGMGEVYLARQRGLAGFEKLLVIKTLLPHLCEDDEFIDMFQDEARLTARLIHPNICQTFEFDQVEGTYYIAMEYLHGEDVRRLWKAASNKGLPVPVGLICRIIADAASGLDFAHGLRDVTGAPYGIVHRDISPQNIVVTFEGGVKIIDFGVAKAQGRATHTRTGALKGKYSYMSPEQVNGLHIDHRSDVFALGIVLYELLTAVRLFKSDSDISTIERVKLAVVPLPSSVNPDLPPGLDDIVLRALAKDPAKRYQTAQQFRLALEDWLVGERMSASSAHLAEFLKTVYADRLLKEAQSGPLVADEGLAGSNFRPGSKSNGPRASKTAAGRPAALEAGALAVRTPAPKPLPPPPVEAQTQDTRVEAEQDTPSRLTPLGKPGSAQGQVGVDLSVVETGSGLGTPRARRAKLAAGAVLAVLLTGLAVLWLTQKPAVEATAQTRAQRGPAREDGRPREPQRDRGDTTAQATAAPEGSAAEAQAAAPAAKSASVTILIKSDPEDAEVSDGARILGRTPFNWTTARGEAHALTFHHDGYRELTQQVTVTGEDLSVRLSRLEARRPEARPRRDRPAPSADAADQIKLER